MKKMTAKSLKPTPVDTGWSWVILASAFCCYGLAIASLKCFGLLFAELLELFGRMASTTAVVPSLHIAALQFSGLPANILATKIGMKSVVIIGGVCISLGYFTTAFVPQMEYMYLTLTISGTGLGFVLTPSIAITNHYFSVHRAKATGVVAASPAVLAVGLPHLYRFLIDQYSMRGALILIAGIMLHVCVFASFYREPVGEDVTIYESVDVVGTNSEKDTSIEVILNEKLLTNDKENSLVQNRNCKTSIMKRGGYSNSEAEEMPLTENTLRTRQSTVDTKEKRTKSTQLQKFQFSVIKIPAFLYYGFSIFAALSGYNIFMMILPTYAKIVTGDSNSSTTILSVFSVAEIVAAVGFGWFIDLKIVTCKTIWTCCMTIAGVAVFCGYFANSMVSLCAVTILCGTFGGTMFLLRSLVIVETIGIDRLVSGLGLSTLFTGIGAIVSAPLAGLIKDETGSWNGACVLAGSLFVCGGLIMQIDTVHKRWLRTGNEGQDSP